MSRLIANGLHPESASPAGQLFANASNAHIHGGHFTAIGIVNNTNAVQFRNAKDPFEHLQEHVSTSAFHNSAKRVDPPRCHENTRTVVINDIFNWILQDTMRTTWILWLNGAAGAGKTAIGQSVAELCVARGILVASFFFFRTDPTRNSAAHVVATFAYQLIQLVPVIKVAILEIIESNPLIFQQSFETQFEELIIRPLSLLQTSNLTWRLLLIIDGIDECDGDSDQANILRTIAKILGEKNLPIIVMLSSRMENKLKMVFNSPKIKDILTHVPLDWHYLPDNDIRLFLRDSFQEIKQTHPFGYLLNHDWPALELVEEIVVKSSGQFIYASVVIKFISSPNSNPIQQLEIVRGLRASGEESPFAQLDALYRHIFSCVQNIDFVISILAYVILGDDPNMFSLARLLGVPQSDLDVALAALSSIITWKKNDYEPPSVVFLHASLPDFLLDETRSHEYHISASTWSTHFTTLWFRKVASDRRRGMYYSDNCDAILKLLRQASGSRELRESILNFTPAYSYCHMLAEFVTAIQYLDFGDEGEAYRHQLVISTRFLWNVQPALISPLLDEHDILTIMATIESEITETHELMELQAKQDSESRNVMRQRFQKREMARQKAAIKDFDENESTRRQIDRAKYDAQEGQRREAERKEFNERETARRQAERERYSVQEEKRREDERKEYGLQEAARRDSERKKIDLQDATRREAARREAEREVFEVREAARREVERREYDRQEAERREAARKEFDTLEAAKREAAKKELEIQERRHVKSSLWSKLKIKR